MQIGENHPRASIECASEMIAMLGNVKKFIVRAVQDEGDKKNRRLGKQLRQFGWAAMGE